MILTTENYFSSEAMTEYFSVSQYKDFVGTLGQRGCEARAMAKMRGEWQTIPTTAMLVGSYVDSHFEGTLDVFCSQNPQLFKKKSGDLLAPYIQAENIINRIENDPYFMRTLAGEKQVIFTGEIFGVQWKCKIDSLNREFFITDLKIMRDNIREAFWAKDVGYMSFVPYWGYDIQAAVYQKLVTMKLGRELPFFLSVATKNQYPDIAVIGFDQPYLDSVLSTIHPNIARIKALKEGTVEPDRCENCDYCKSTKVLCKAIHFSELILDI